MWVLKAGDHISRFDCISIIFLPDFVSRVAVIWISFPELSYVFHIYAIPICAPMKAENYHKHSCIL